MIQFIWDHFPGINGYWNFLVLEVAVTAAAIWWFIIDKPVTQHVHTPIKKFKFNQLDSFRKR